MHEVKAVFHGRVQAVGFRATAERFAKKLSLKGYVKNCSDGTVALVAQGDKEDLENFIDQLQKTFDIHHADISYVKPSTTYPDFSATAS